MDYDTKATAKRSWMKTAGIAVGSFAVLLLAKGVGSVVGRAAGEQTAKEFRSEYERSATGAALTAGLEKAALQLKKQTPVKVDEVTTLRDVITAGKEIVYLMDVRMSLNPDELVKFQALINEQNQRDICSNQTTRKLIELGGVMTYRYRFSDAETLSASVMYC